MKHCVGAAHHRLKRRRIADVYVMELDLLADLLEVLLVAGQEVVYNRDTSSWNQRPNQRGADEPGSSSYYIFQVICHVIFLDEPRSPAKGRARAGGNRHAARTTRSYPKA